MDFTARCHCSAVTHSLNLQTPLTAHACMCNSCRSGSGLLCTLHLMIPSAPFPDADNPPETLILYKQKERARGYFCKTCGAMVFGTFGYGENEIGWCVSVGCLEPKSGKLEEFVNLKNLYYVGDTQDGGCAPWIATGLEHIFETGDDGKDLSLDDIKAMEKKYIESEAFKTVQKETSLEGSCLCGDVRVRVKRKTGWIVNEDEPERYATIHCACTDCRLLSGGEVMSFVITPLINTYLVGPDPLMEGEESEEPWPFSLVDAQAGRYEDAWKSLIVYKSSENVTRASCGKCGACVSYQHPDFKGVSLCAGLFAKEGMGGRRDDWFDWKSADVGYVESAKRDGREGLFVGRFADGVKEWRSSASATE